VILRVLLSAILVYAIACAPGMASTVAAESAPLAQPPAAGTTPPPARPDQPPATFLPPGEAAVPATPVRLFAAVEEAWIASSAERLAALVDTTRVRIALKPGAEPSTAVTRGAAAFLFQDPMRLVQTREFRIVKVEVPGKGPARATARWVGDWGGRQGVKRVRVTLLAKPAAGGWLLTEVRSSD
jgi:hypothetical protein